jgi:hypothetical protein
MPSPKALSPAAKKELLATLEARFAKHPQRHPDLAWSKVESKLLAAPSKLASILQMELTGGEPDVVRWKGGLVYVDGCKETPAGRRSCCFDAQALDERKENKPAHSAQAMADEMGIQMLDEAAYRAFQEILGEFDLKTSSWIVTPPAIRTLGGALFMDCRYKTVFLYHNGASSYYSARAFRGMIQL